MQRHLYTLLIITIITLAACERPVDIHIEPLPARITVVSNFTPGQPIAVTVSKSRPILSNDDPDYIENATVRLYQGDNLLETFSLQPGDSGQTPRYVSQAFRPAAQTTYRLEVEAPGLPSVKSSSQIPAAAPIRSLRVSDVQVSGNSNQRIFSYLVTIIFADPVGVPNFYHLDFYQQIWNYEIEAGDTLIRESRQQSVTFSSENDNNSLIAYFNGGVLFDDSGFDGAVVAYSFTLQTSIDPAKEIIGNMLAELRTTSREYYLFHNSLSRQQTSPGGPFSEPVIIYNNIKNGRGIFAGYHPVLDSVAIQ